MSLMNRLHNARNPHQGSTKKVLCVCSAGLLRSPTLAHMLATKGFNTRAAGLEEAFALIPVDDVLLLWADVILCMDSDQAERINQRLIDRQFLDETTPVISLNVPDNFGFMDKQLCNILEHKISQLKENSTL